MIRRQIVRQTKLPTRLMSSSLLLNQYEIVCGLLEDFKYKIAGKALDLALITLEDLTILCFCYISFRNIFSLSFNYSRIEQCFLWREQKLHKVSK